MLSAGIETLRELCERAGDLVHLAASGETSWYGFACAIVESLKARGVALAVEGAVPIATEEYPTKARRPLNSRLDLARLHNDAATLAECPVAGTRPAGAGIDHHLTGVAPPSKARY
jgi:dTDP-4-dehydrorhamnose reductase